MSETRQQPPSTRGLSLPACLVSAVGVAIIGSATLGGGEFLAGWCLSPISAGDAGLPRDIVLAAVGRTVLSDLLLWLPLMLLSGLLLWTAKRRKPASRPEPTLFSTLLILTTAIILPGDLSTANATDAIAIAMVVIFGGAAAAGVYCLLRWLCRRMGEKRFGRAFLVATITIAVLGSIPVGMFVRSPLYSPGDYRVAAASGKTQSHRGPHVLWIVLDTARADRMTVHGHDRDTTPFLKEWSQGCLVFDRAIANGMWTLPVHASMFTGLPVRTHSLGYVSERLDDSLTTVAEVLEQEGYATGFFSNNALICPATNLTQGFGTALILFEFQQATRFSLERLCELAGLVPPVPWLDMDYGAALTGHVVDRWLDEHTDQPVCVFINYMEAHLPYRVPRACRELFMTPEQVRRSYELRRSVYGDIETFLHIDGLVDGYEHGPESDREIIKRQYDAGLRCLDDRVREMIDIFRRRGLLENTLVVITSDHGEYLDTHGMWSHHYLTYEDVTHVPLLIREPGRAAGRRIATPVQLTDLYPTVLRAVLGPAAAEPTPDARDLLEVAARGGEERIAIIECHGTQLALTRRLLAQSDPAVRHRATRQIAAVEQRYKYIESDDGMREVYDLVADPGELRNQGGTHFQARRLGAAIKSWLARVPAYQPKAGEGGRPSREML